MDKSMEDKKTLVQKIFSRHGGVMRTREILEQGIHERTLYEMLRQGQIERLSRGLYRPADFPPLGSPDLVIVAKRIPEGVICLISALYFHGLTTQVPHAVYLAVKAGARRPKRIEHPPVQVFSFREKIFEAGAEKHLIDDVPLQVYSPEKTMVDCFRFRNRIGLDITLEALKMYREKRPLQVNTILQYARLCRVEKGMRPYLESVL